MCLNKGVMKELFLMLILTLPNAFIFSQANKIAVIERKIPAIKDLEGERIVYRYGYDTSYSNTPLMLDSITEVDISIDYNQTVFGGYRNEKVDLIKQDSLKMIHLFEKGLNSFSTNYTENSSYQIIIKPKIIYRKDESFLFMKAVMSIGNFDIFLVNKNDTLFKAFFEPIVANGSMFSISEQKEFEKLINQCGLWLRVINNKLRREQKKRNKR